jgi:hypothetical protein
MGDTNRNVRGQVKANTIVEGPPPSHVTGDPYRRDPSRTDMNRKQNYTFGSGWMVNDNRCWAKRSWHMSPSISVTTSEDKEQAESKEFWRRCILFIVRNSKQLENTTFRKLHLVSVFRWGGRHPVGSFRKSSTPSLDPTEYMTPSSHLKTKTPSFWNVVFSTCLEFRTMDKFHRLIYSESSDWG